MLYAQTHIKEWPLEWEECSDMHKYLNRMVWGYQLILEKKMFATQFGMEYRGTLLKWVDGENKPILKDKRREVLLETSDICQMKAALFMLISEAEQEGKKHKRSMVP